MKSSISSIYTWNKHSELSTRGKTEAINFKKNQEDYMDGFGEKKGK